MNAHTPDSVKSGRFDHRRCNLIDLDQIQKARVTRLKPSESRLENLALSFYQNGYQENEINLLKISEQISEESFDKQIVNKLSFNSAKKSSIVNLHN